MDAIIDIPDWILAEQPVMKRTGTEMAELRDKQYEIAFEYVLDHIAIGESLRQSLKDYHLPIEYSKFYQWIKKDDTREERYQEAKRIGSEVMEDEIVEIADAEHNALEDVARSRLKIEARMLVMKARNPKRYSPTKDSGLGTIGPVTIQIGTVQSPYENHPALRDIEGSVVVDALGAPDE